MKRTLGDEHTQLDAARLWKDPLARAEAGDAALPENPAGDIDLTELPPPRDDLRQPEPPCRCGGTGTGELGLPTDAAFLRWIDPLVAEARDALAERLRKTAAGSGVDWSPPAGHPLLVPDTDQLLRMTKRVLVLELNVARVRGQLCGDSPTARFACFCRGLQDPETAQGLLAEYPVLARELAGHLRQWTDTRVEFLARLLGDLPSLCETFGLPPDIPLDLVDVVFGAGDSHRAGRTVAIVTVDGTSVVYKPRPLACERHFSEFVRWLNAQGLPHPLRAPAVLDRGDYGWAEHVAWRPCADDGELARFYWRLGASVAVFYVLRAHDMHMSNVIASGDCPVFVDMEAMFHAPTRVEDGDDEHGPAVGPALRESVLASLVLPQPVVTVADDTVHSTDISALAGGREPDRAGTGRSLAYADDGTDRMRVVRRRAPAVPSHNRPCPADQDVDAGLMRAQLDAGFEACYRLLMDRRATLLDDRGPIAAFADDEVRVVLRDTAVYRTLLAESWHPDLLRDALDRERFLDLLTVRGAVADHPGVVASERRQLAGNDIPLFTVRAAGTVLSDPEGEIASGLFHGDGMSRVRRRVDALSERDLDEQRWYLHASLATLPDADRIPLPAAPSAPYPDRGVDAGLAVRAAHTIADRLLKTALRDGSEPGAEWASLNLLGDSAWVIGRTGLGLRAGVTGIALFLAELDNLTDTPRYRHVVDDVVGALLDAEEAPAVEDLEGMSIGAYEDLGSVLYLVARLREIRGDAFPLDPLRWLVPAIRHNMSDDDRGDVLGGASGAALVLLRMQRVQATDATADALDQVGHRLAGAAAGPAPRLVGFGRGLSGRAYALASLGEATGRPSFVDAAREALDAERGLPPDNHAGGWCGGSAGVALARAAMLDVPRCASLRPALEDDLRQAIGRVCDRLTGEGAPAALDDSLCHGGTGMVEALRQAARHLADEELLALARRTTGDIAHRVLTGTMTTGVPTGVWTPGLLEGAAGVGYGLLRAAAPDTVPNVLALGPFGGGA